MTKIRDILAQNTPSISFEVFPPKTAASFASVEQAAMDIAALHPSFMSVTYGAGGGTRKYTADIAASIQSSYGVTSLAHLTCVSLNGSNLVPYLENLKQLGIENILALRGDLPADMTELAADSPYRHADELVAAIKQYSDFDFCIGGACYPEGHPESATKDEDIRNLKKKVDAGCDFLTTQMFFDNSIMFNYMYRLREAGISVPVCAGIMPVTNKNQIDRICRLSGSCMPARFMAIVDRFGDNPQAMTQAGIAYATDQIIDLIANGINHIHVYSMNKPEVAAGICRNLSTILPGVKGYEAYGTI